MPHETYLISLARRPDRRQHALTELTKAGISPLNLFDAIDGKALPLPLGWRDGPGAYGCRESHRRVLEDAILKGLDTVTVFEDDVTLVPNYQSRLKELMALLPEDWDCLFLGGQHKEPPTLVKPGLMQCTNCHRTHAYVLRGQYIKIMYRIWSSEFGHVDHVWGRHQTRAKCFAPETWLAGQSASKSDINGRDLGAGLPHYRRCNSLQYL